MNGMRLFLCVMFGILVVSVADGQTNVNYPTQIQPIFDNNCISCHGGRSGVTLSSYASVIASVGVQYAKNVIQPGSSATSPLYDKISNATPAHGRRMPYTGPPYLSDAQITLIKNWIDEGAKPSATTTSVAVRIAGVPENFSLSQNYPNPFNPSTQIAFALPVRQFVTLTVYDMLGHEVATLVNGELDPGTYRIRWNASDVSSGIYFYRLQTTGAQGTPHFTETRKLIVEK